jgi:hypothetical protein
MVKFSGLDWLLFWLSGKVEKLVTELTRCATFFCFSPFKACLGGSSPDMTQLLDPPTPDKLGAKKKLHTT